MLLMIRRLFQAFIRPTAVRLGVFPTSADGAAALAVTVTSAAVAWTVAALWTEIVAAAGVTVDQQLVGITLDNFVGAPSQGEVLLAVGALGSEVEIARFPATVPYYDLVPSLMVLAGQRISAKYRTSTGAADSVDVKLMMARGV